MYYSTVCWVGAQTHCIHFSVQNTVHTCTVRTVYVFVSLMFPTAYTNILDTELYTEVNAKFLNPFQLASYFDNTQIQLTQLELCTGWANSIVTTLILNNSRKIKYFWLKFWRCVAKTLRFCWVFEILNSRSKCVFYDV